MDYAILLVDVILISIILLACLKCIEFFVQKKGIRFIGANYDTQSVHHNTDRVHHDTGGYKEDARHDIKTTDTEYCLKVFAVQLLCWTPVFLAYYPGLFTYDVMSQIPQQMGTYSTNHPLLHTLYLQFFYYVIGGKVFNNFTVGIAFATIVQMIIFSAMIVYVHLFLKRMNVSKIIRYILIAFTSISPIFSLLGISMTKDVLFAGCVGMMVTSLAYLTVFQQFSNKKTEAIYILSIVGSILLRNNGIYPVVILTITVIIMALRNSKIRKLAICTVAGLLLGFLISTMLACVLHAEKGSLNEALSLPYQQIACAYVVNKGQLSADELEEVKKIIPNVDHCRAATADPVKIDAQGMEYFGDFVTLYLKLAMKCPSSYLRAFCLLNAGYLSVSDVTFAKIYGTSDRQGIFLTDTKDGFDVYHTSFFSGLENIYEELYTDNKYENVVVLKLLCSPAFYFWILIGTMLYVAAKKRKDMLPMQIYMLVLLLTMLVGPCCLIRYALPYIVCVPVYLACAAYKNKAEDSESVAPTALESTALSSSH